VADASQQQKPLGRRSVPRSSCSERSGTGKSGLEKLLPAAMLFLNNRQKIGCNLRPFTVLYYKRSNIMPQSIKLSDELLQEAGKYAAVYSRSIPKQIEYWSRIGRIVEENPDLSYDFIKEILLAKTESENGKLTKYIFD